MENEELDLNSNHPISETHTLTLDPTNFEKILNDIYEVNFTICLLLAFILGFVLSSFVKDFLKGWFGE
ncbi:MAG: hypothetical protein ACRC7N_20055 [Clostridium sp.]